MGNDICCGGGLSKLMCAILINMDKDETIINEKYNKYYKSKNAKEGVKQIIKNNEFYINGFPIPGTEEEFLRKTPNGYLVNQKKWLTKTEEGYNVMQNGNYSNYDEAAFITAIGFNAGLEVRLFDLDEDNFVDHIELYYVEAMIVNNIIKNEDKTIKIYRVEVNDTFNWEENDGRIYDGNNFTKKTDEIIYDYNFSHNIKKGNIVLFSYRPEGWVIEKGKEVKGILVNGEDHKFYQIGALKFQDAMRFSRDNIIISNRCGEFYNVHKYFGFLNNKENLQVSLWFVNSYDENRFAAPAGFTTGQNSKFFLSKAIEFSKKKLNSVVISNYGNKINKGIRYVSQKDFDDFDRAIKRAEKALNDRCSNELMDYHVYLLYFANCGSENDIGAKYAGFKYVGFDNQIKYK